MTFWIAVDVIALIAPAQTPDKDRRIAGVWAFMLQIVSECLSSFHRQGQDVLSQRFRTPQRHRARPPVDVADHEMGDFA